MLHLGERVVSRSVMESAKYLSGSPVRFLTAETAIGRSCFYLCEGERVVTFRITPRRARLWPPL